MIYYCNEDEDFIVGIHSVDRDPENIARILTKNLEMDLFECESEEYLDHEDSDFSQDTIIIRWSQMESYIDGMTSVISKKINVYVVK